MVNDIVFWFFIACVIIFVGTFVAIYATNPGDDDDDHNYS